MAEKYYWHGNMKSRSLIGTLAILFFSISLVTVFAGYPPAPLITIPAGAPALVGNQVSGIFGITYPNGQPLLLTQAAVVLLVCGSAGGCVKVSATLTSTASGSYTYAFTAPPSVSGAVTITLPAGSLTDPYGNSFPASNMVLGTYTT